MPSWSLKSVKGRRARAVGREHALCRSSINPDQVGYRPKKLLRLQLLGKGEKAFEFIPLFDARVAKTASEAAKKTKEHREAENVFMQAAELHVMSNGEQRPGLTFEYKWVSRKESEKNATQKKTARRRRRKMRGSECSWILDIALAGVISSVPRSGL